MLAVRGVFHTLKVDLEYHAEVYELTLSVLSVLPSAVPHVHCSWDPEPSAGEAKFNGAAWAEC